jgi:serine/threonine protein kinase
MFHIGVATQAPPLPEPGQLSDTGIEFIELCLTLDPPGRPSAEELLYHPWLAAMVQHLVRTSQGITNRADVPCSSFQTDYSAAENASSGGLSSNSTLVDHSYETQVYAAKMEELAHQQQSVEGEDLGAFGPATGNSSPAPE